MSVRGRRRYDDAESVSLLMVDERLVILENTRYQIVFQPDIKTIEENIEDHVDFVVLFAIWSYQKKYITKHECERLIDKIEGYYYAFVENLINFFQLYEKLNAEIIVKELQGNDTDFIGVYKR